VLPVARLVAADLLIRSPVTKGHQNAVFRMNSLHRMPLRALHTALLLLHPSQPLQNQPRPLPSQRGVREADLLLQQPQLEVDR